MRYEQAKDVLGHARHFYQLIADYYHRMSDHSQKPRIKMLLDYLTRHEEHLAETMAEYQASAPKQVRNAWFKYSPCEEKLHLLQKLLEEEVSTVDDITEMAMKLDDCLIDMYQELSENASSEEVREVFQNILELEKKEKLKSMRDILLMEDL